jgi:tetratricopeptide (TPR) repeat protein
MKRLEESELSLRKAIELRPDFADAYLSLGKVLKNLGHLEEAELSLRKAIKINPNLAYIYLILGDILRINGKIKEAKITSEKTIYLKPWSINGSYTFNYQLITD